MATQAEREQTRPAVEQFRDPPAAQALSGHVWRAWIWLILRLYAGWTWLQAGWEKLSSPTWTGSKAGTALTRSVDGALKQTTGAHPNVQSWYGWFLQHAVLPVVTGWSYLVSIGEFLVGVALILGIFTGIAAFFGGFMNINYLMAGAVSINPILFIIEILLILAWKTAGWWGLDRWLLPALGTAWSPRVRVPQRRVRRPDACATSRPQPGLAGQCNIRAGTCGRPRRLPAGRLAGR